MLNKKSDSITPMIYPSSNIKDFVKKICNKIPISIKVIGTKNKYKLRIYIYKP